MASSSSKHAPWTETWCSRCFGKFSHVKFEKDQCTVGRKRTACCSIFYLFPKLQMFGRLVLKPLYGLFWLPSFLSPHCSGPSAFPFCHSHVLSTQKILIKCSLLGKSYCNAFYNQYQTIKVKSNHLPMPKLLFLISQGLMSWDAELKFETSNSYKRRKHLLLLLKMLPSKPA